MTILANAESTAPERVLTTLDSVRPSEALRKSKRMRELLRYLVQEFIARPGEAVTTVSRLRAALAALGVALTLGASACTP